MLTVIIELPNLHLSVEMIAIGLRSGHPILDHISSFINIATGSNFKRNGFHMPVQISPLQQRAMGWDVLLFYTHELCHVMPNT